MKILVVSIYGETINVRLTGGKPPEVGTEYFLEDATRGTGAQNRFFHVLIRIYFQSGCFSDDALTEAELKRCILRRLTSWKMEKFAYSDREGKLHVVRERSDIPQWIMDDPEEKKARVIGYAPDPRWSDTDLKERNHIIKSLISEMNTTGVSGQEFEGILKEFYDG